MIVSCDLDCKNGGYCSFLTHDGIMRAPTKGDSSGPPYEHSSDQYCVCPHGWAGSSCLDPTNSIDRCHSSGDLYVCRSGGLCHPVESFTDLLNDEEEWQCDCKLADTVNAFSGAMCREPAMEYCNTDGSSFCTNGGTCVSNLINFHHFERSGDCICPPDFTGPHCEFLSLQFEMSNYPHGNGKDALSKSIGSYDAILFLLFSAVALVSAISLFVWKKMKVSVRNLNDNRPHLDPVRYSDDVVAAEDSNRGDFILYDVPLI